MKNSDECANCPKVAVGVFQWKNSLNSVSLCDYCYRIVNILNGGDGSQVMSTKETLYPKNEPKEEIPIEEVTITVTDTEVIKTPYLKSNVQALEYTHNPVDEMKAKLRARFESA